MENSLFAFIWKHSKRQQLLLLGVTLLSFPFLYASLELPKRIINDAIEAETEMVTVALGDLSVELSQLQYLALLCAGFLAAVLGHGLMKMRINTMKGILAERLLRRFRYQLIHRVLRFPQPYFRRTSQGELTSMITSEAEPMGGIMGDLVAQPVFQGGMMLTIATFLFVQSFWLGLAAVALIPVQAYVIPLLQRRINRLNKDRVQEVRRLAEEIGESAAGVGDLRMNGGWRLHLARVSERLGRLFDIRYRIYRQKFFMKFLNNFITQLTPFFFFSIGGYLAIQGHLSVGALVAALAAYKDLSAPWKELLAYYNQTQDMSLRWRIVTERFQPAGVIDEELFEGRPAEIPRLTGPLEMEGVSVREPDGTAVLENLTLTVPPGACVAVASRSANERRAFGELIAREVSPAAGRVRLAGHDLASLHQGTIAARIGYAGTRPYLFNGTIGENLTMSLRTLPRGAARAPEVEALMDEARRAGNSADPAGGDWLDPSLAGLESEADLRDWWLRLVEAMGTDEYLFTRGLDQRFEASDHPHLAERLVALRPEIARRVEAAGLDRALHRFREDAFNPGLPVAGNLLFATPTRDITQEALAGDARFVAMLREIGLESELLVLAQDVMGLLERIFGRLGTDHPLFLKLDLEPGMFHRLLDIETRARERGLAALGEEERALLLTVPFRFTAEQVGAPFPPRLKERILELRRTRAPELRERAADVFAPLDPKRLAPGLTVLENALYAKISRRAGARADKLRQLVADALLEDGLKSAVAELIYDVRTGLGGANLPPVAHERIAFVRAAIKRPDVLILDRALASHDERDRKITRARLRELLPETMLIFLEEDFRSRDAFDMFVEIEDGRIVNGTDQGEDARSDRAGADLSRKLRKLEKVDLFSGLERRQLRLLAFGSQWFAAGPGEPFYRAGDPSDGAYLVLSGNAELRWPDAGDGERPVTVVEPGRLIGDLLALRGEPRRQDLVAVSAVEGLRIDAETLRTVVEADAGVAMSLLRTVSGYLIDAAERARGQGQEVGDAAAEPAVPAVPKGSTARPTSLPVPVEAPAKPPGKPPAEREEV